MPDPRPIPVLTAAQAAEWDERARSQASIPGRVLMEAAGRAAAGVIAREFRDALGQGVVVAAGPGNNGGDGWVVARALHAAGVRVLAVETSKNRSSDCEANRALALADGVTTISPASPWPAVGLVVDALLGTGAGDAPRGPVADLARRVADHGAPVAAIDGPTGLDLTTGTTHGPVRAALTVTFGGLRRGHLLARDWVGTLVVVDIGFPPADPAWPVLATDAWAAALLPPLVPVMHKGDRGRVLVIGGDVGMAGAAMHVGRAAFACGAGLVKLALAEPSIRAAQANLPDALTVTTALGPGLEPELEEAIGWADAIVLGPGLGRGEARSRLAHAVLERARAAVVIDADALQVPDLRAAGTAPRVLTPHPGEFSAQFPEIADLPRTDRFAAPAAALDHCARPTPGVSRGSPETAILLKGVPTVITARRGCRVVASGNPALATGGTGDVLAGTIATWLARGLTPLDAATLGAHAMGRAAELAAGELGARVTRPEDVVGQYPRLWELWAAPPPPEPPVLLRLDPPAVS
jgi:NAD(P)H-hydrate epimerase